MRLPALLTLILSMALLSACGKDTTPAPAPSGGTSTPPAETVAPTGDGRPQIAIIPRDGNSPYGQALHAGALKALGEARKGADGKPTIDLLWQPPPNPEQFDSQVKTAQSLLKSGVAVLIVAPDDEATLTAITTAAAAAKIPVIALDAPFNTDNCKSAISCDDATAGQLAAKTLDEMLKHKGTVVMLTFTENPRKNMIEKAAGAALATYPALKFRPIAVHRGQGTLDAAFTTKKLGEPPLDFDAIFAPEESNALSVISSLQKAALTGKINVVAVGNSPELAAALKSGDISALILTDPVATGYQAVNTAIDCIKEKKVPKHMDIPLHVATRENMDTPEVAALLHPPVDKYLPK